MFTAKPDKNKEQFKCYCWTCKKARKKLNELGKEETALTYHMVKILKELLGMDNF